MEMTSELKEQQYKDSFKFNARVALHAKYSTNKYPWPLWIFDQIDQVKDAHVLELGCGNGLLWKANAIRIPQDWNLTLSDFSQGMLKETQNNLNAQIKNVAYIEIDAEEIKYPDNTFDIVIANNILYHVRHIKKALAEISRVLKADGKLYSTTMGSNHMKELKSIMAEFNPSSKYEDSLSVLAESFSLKNGEQQLKEFFAEVKLVTYQDSLEVTDAEAIVNYFLSCNGLTRDTIVLKEDEQARFKDFIARKIAAKGKIYISKESGMFISTGKTQYLK
jgi:ubiquinone/menaquinone biosynthesis C-methylase UbiE